MIAAGMTASTPDPSRETIESEQGGLSISMADHRNRKLRSLRTLRGIDLLNVLIAIETSRPRNILNSVLFVADRLL